MALFERVLTRLHVPGTLPEVVIRVIITIRYSAQATERGLPADRKTHWDGMCEELEGLLKVGFLARPWSGDIPASVTAQPDGANGLVITATTSGAHVNLVHAMVRLVVASHHTPDGAFAEVLRINDGDVEAARAMFNGMVIDRDVDAIMVQASGPDGIEPMQVDIRNAIWHNVHMPTTGILGEDAVLQAGEVTFTNLAIDSFDEEIDFNYLGVAGMDAFLPIGFPADHEPGEEELFCPEPGMMLAHDISIEQVYLFELLAAINGGDISRVRAEVSET